MWLWIFKDFCIVFLCLPLLYLEGCTIFWGNSYRMFPNVYYIPLEASSQYKSHMHINQSNYFQIGSVAWLICKFVCIKSLFFPFARLNVIITHPRQICLLFKHIFMLYSCNNTLGFWNPLWTVCLQIYHRPIYASCMNVYVSTITGLEE
jgi:hypothetical protein